VVQFLLSGDLGCIRDQRITVDEGIGAMKCQNSCRHEPQEFFSKKIWSTPESLLSISHALGNAGIA